jgi:hypothetical protein
MDHVGPHMAELVETIKVRVPEGTRGVFAELAEERHLDESDIYREALRLYVEAHKPKEVAS